MTKRPTKQAKKSAKKSTAKQIDDTVENVVDQLEVNTIADELKAGATIKRSPRK